MVRQVVLLLQSDIC